MTAPELEKPVVPEAIQIVQESFTPEQEKHLQEYGIQVRPQAMQNVTNAQGQVIAQSTDPANQAQTMIQVAVPVDQPTAENWSKGSINDSQTWYGVKIIRTIKQALHNSWKLVIGKN